MRGLGKKVAVCRPEREPSPGGDPADTPTLTSGLEKREDSRSVAEAAPSQRPERTRPPPPALGTSMPKGVVT